jgi:uncharacterized protein (DUF1778 family)
MTTEPMVVERRRGLLNLKVNQAERELLTATAKARNTTVAGLIRRALVAEGIAIAVTS